MRYYFDTSIWLDLFEKREEFPYKFTSVQRLLKYIRLHNDKIVYSKAVIDELRKLGYSSFELGILFRRFRQLLIRVWQTKHHYGKAKDLAAKRDIPFFDALHALLAREAKAILISRDKDFQRLQDIVINKKPEEIIQAS